MGCTPRSNRCCRWACPSWRRRSCPDWFDWPALPDLFPVSFPGVKTSRDGFLVDTDLDRFRARVGEYFDPALSHEEIARRYPRVMKSTARFDAPAVRDALLKRGGPDESGFVRFAYRPFDNRWLYWEKDTKLLDEKRADYRPHAFEGNLWLEAREREAKEEFSRGTLVVDLADNFGNGLSSWFPSWLLDDGMASNGREGRRANLTGSSGEVSRPSWHWRGGSVPPRLGHHARSGLPRGQRRGTAHGVASHSTAWLARWRCRRGGLPARPIGSARALNGCTARFRDGGSGRHPSAAAARSPPPSPFRPVARVAT